MGKGGLWRGTELALSPGSNLCWPCSFGQATSDGKGTHCIYCGETRSNFLEAAGKAPDPREMLGSGSWSHGLSDRQTTIPRHPCFLFLHCTVMWAMWHGRCFGNHSCKPGDQEGPHLLLGCPCRGKGLVSPWRREDCAENLGGAGLWWWG